MADSFVPGFRMSGRGGEVVQGRRVLSTLGKWQCSPSGNTERLTLRITVLDHEPDPYYLQHHDPDRPIYVDLQVGTRTQRKRARIVSPGTNGVPLVIEAWNEE